MTDEQDAYWIVTIDGTIYQATEVRKGWSQLGGQPRIDIAGLRAHYEGELGAPETVQGVLERVAEGRG